MTDTQKIEALVAEAPAVREAFEALRTKTKKAEDLMAAALVREELLRSEVAQLKAEKRSERERIADELRKFAEAQGDPSGWISAIAEAVETEWTALNDPSAFAKVPCRFEVQRELEEAKAENAKLREGARAIADLESETRSCFDPADAEQLWDTLQDALSKARSLLEGGE